MKVLRYISSWWLTVILLLGLCSVYMYFTFGEKSFEKWINYIFHEPIGLILYTGIIVNLIFVSLRIGYTRLRHKVITTESFKNMDAFMEIPISKSCSFKKIVEWIKKKGFLAGINENNPPIPPLVNGGEGGFESSLSEQENINSLRGRFSFLPGTVLRTGIIMIMMAFIFSVHLRRTEEAIFHEGDAGVLLGEKIEVKKIKSDMPDEFLQVGEKGNFNMDTISVALSESQREYSINGGFPLRINGLYYRIINFGYNQPISVNASPLKIERSLDLDILPPGKTDIVTIPSDNLILTFTLQPDKTIKKGLLTGKLFNLRIPNYSIVIQKGGDREKTEAISIRPQEDVTARGYNISLGKNSSFVRIQSVYDPALLWIYIGILLTLTGTLLMLSRFFWYEREIVALVTDNRVLIGYREEFYKKWGIQKFYGWMEEIPSSTKSSINETDSSD